MAKRFHLTAQEVSDAVSDYVLEKYFPNASEIDCAVSFGANPKGATVDVLAEREPAASKRKES